MQIEIQNNKLIEIQSLPRCYLDNIRERTKTVAVTRLSLGSKQKEENPCYTLHLSSHSNLIAI